MHRYYDTYQWLLTHRKKAAKKARNRKKWYAKYGGGVTEAFLEQNSFLSMIPKDESYWQGASIQVPLFHQAADIPTPPESPPADRDEQNP